MTTKQRWVLALISLASLMIMLDALVVTTALQAIRLDLGASAEQLEWSVNAYTLPFAVLMMAGAAVGDRYGRKRVFIIGIVVFTIASVACALSPSIGWLIAARALQGIGAAASAPVAQTILTSEFSPEERPKALGVYWGMTGLATLGGPIVGGIVVETAAWQWIFWLNVPLAVVLLPLIIAKLPESHGEARRMDFAGIGLVTIAVFGLVWGLVRGNVVDWTSAEVLAALIGGALALVAFVWWELRTTDPLLPLRFFKSRAFSAGNASVFLLFASTFGGLFFFAQFLQTVLHHGPLGAGVRLAPWTVTVILFAPIAGKLVNKFGERPLVAGGLLMQAIASGWFAVIAGPDVSYSSMIAPFVLAGAGTSMVVPAATAAVYASVPEASFGAASGTFSTMRQLGGAFGIALAVAVFVGAGGYGSVQQFTDGFGAAMVAATVVALIGVVAGLAFPTRRPAPVPEKVAA
ncbi:DHA2 family efflux MFS transporter permease subunit [Streptomyces peucetius]|uniref:DHA2 family efflux MFS transporter permease subunit n=1 Tax=Streptomyces peucetius TaxID=1950 RepID=A0ABY6IGV0_STRPE|nr:DHA2 family efflux MFS transporter permease subunit [Streptomyces peucetius]UYQ66238.1 DHA2 family efflux MFS transporter permease subunit [Streptomyces peucetius]WGG89249.1 PcnH [Streptomyces peucetius]